MQNNFRIVSRVAKFKGMSEDWTYTYSKILAGCMDYIDSSGITAHEIFEALVQIADSYSDDFCIDFDGAEFRIINDSAVWDIYVDEIKSVVENCYELNLDKIPDFIAVSIDWEQTANNAYIDGYGHSFSGYDGGEEFTGEHWIFRTN